MTRTALALILALAATAARAGGALERQPAESAESFTCRTVQIPEARRCVARCDAAYRAEEEGDLRWSCVHACTVNGLWAMADCRATLAAGGKVGATPLPATSVASR